MSKKNISPRLWWEREDLGYRKDRLFLGSQDLLEFAQSAGAPMYLYNSARIKKNLTRLAQALEKKEIRYKIYYALKANRFLPLVTYLKILGRCGLDVCSSGELRLARQAGFNQREITYTGTSISNEDLDCLQRNPHVWINCDAISTIKRLGERCPGIDALDIGGGLGIPVVEGQEPLDIDQWANIISKHAKKRDLEIILEPGDYLVKDCGVLILQVNTVEEKGGTQFIGVNGGFNIQNLPAYYDTPLIIAPLSRDSTASREQVTIAGNINEAIDIMAQDILFPPVHEGDFLGCLNVGGYGAAASSNHCMRGTFSEYFLIE